MRHVILAFSVLMSSPALAQAPSATAPNALGQIVRGSGGSIGFVNGAGQYGAYLDASGTSWFAGSTMFSGAWGAVNLYPSGTSAALTLQEAGANSNNGLVQHPAILIDLSNIGNTAPNKHGFNCVLWDANNTSAENADCISLTTYHQYNTPAQGASEASAFYASETGGGNTLSIYNLAENAPSGLLGDYNNGRAIEVGVDGNKVGVSIEQHGTGGAGTGKALWVLTADNTNGIVYQPYDDAAPTTRALQIINAANAAEKAFITKSGNGYFAGSVSIGSNLSVTGPVAPGKTTVAALPACNGSLSGAIEVVTDAVSPTYNSPLTGGGSIVTLALCNGGAWTAH
jgi:hypothetical protein